MPIAVFVIIIPILLLFTLYFYDLCSRVDKPKEWLALPWIFLAIWFFIFCCSDTTYTVDEYRSKTIDNVDVIILKHGELVNLNGRFNRRIEPNTRIAIKTENSSCGLTWRESPVWEILDDKRTE